MDGVRDGDESSTIAISAVLRTWIGRASCMTTPERCRIGRMTVPGGMCKLTWGASLPERLDALWEAWVQAFPNVIPRLGIDRSNVAELEPRRRRV